MFLQVAVPKEECEVLRFPWRDSPEDSIGIFEYNRHVFGAKSSPTCANYGFQQGGRDNKVDFPSAASTIDRNFYMDDLVKSVDSPQAAEVFRAEVNDGVEVSFVLGKCRIALIKQLSIPRLELQAAVYSVRLRTLFVQEHDLRIDSVTHWTDSVTVLQWLHSADKKQNVFVANRAVQILENSTIDEWKHVKGEMNPSDIGTRGITIEKLTESDWLSGPIWLKDHPDDWPSSLQPVTLVPDDPAAVAVIANTSMTQEPIVDWSKFSSFSKCVRVIAFCLRLKFKGQSKVVLPSELQRAEEKVLKLIQRENFLKCMMGSKCLVRQAKVETWQNFLHFSMNAV